MSNKVKIGLAIILHISLLTTLVACGASSNYSAAKSSRDEGIYNSAGSIDSGMGFSSFSPTDSIATNNYSMSKAQASRYTEAAVNQYDSYESSDSYNEEYSTVEDSQPQDQTQINYTNSNNNDQTEEINYEKLVYRAEVTVESKEFDISLNKLNDLVKKYNGIIESKQFTDGSDWEYYYNYGNGQHRNYYIKVRIPTFNFESFMGIFGDIGHVIETRSNVENISQEYYNNKAYLESYQNQLNNLQNMYSKAVSIEEMLTIEARISDVNAEILKLTTEIQRMDMDVAYSTIDIRLSEVVDYTKIETPQSKDTFLDRLKNALSDSKDNLLNGFEAILFFIIREIWTVLFLVLVLFLVIKIGKAISNKLSEDNNADKKAARIRKKLIKQNKKNDKQINDNVKEKAKELGLDNEAVKNIQDIVDSTKDSK